MANKAAAATKIIAVVIFTISIALPSHARWKPEYASQPQVVQDWYRNAELTPAAKQRFPFKNCCSHSDVVRTQFRVNKSSGGDEWYWLDPQTNQWKRIPPDIIHYDERAPDGQPTLFVWEGRETCFYPGDGEI